mmetsp:Transcript_17233/g.26663  ORF Transcript_17233/g.26663 Transcript_17233/m.26663 type:complete len:91 (-) Transcript_17233:392-664(-)
MLCQRFKDGPGPEVSISKELEIVDACLGSRKTHMACSSGRNRVQSSGCPGMMTDCPIREQEANHPKGARGFRSQLRAKARCFPTSGALCS